MGTVAGFGVGTTRVGEAELKQSRRAESLSLCAARASQFRGASELLPESPGGTRSSRTAVIHRAGAEPHEQHQPGASSATSCVSTSNPLALTHYDIHNQFATGIVGDNDRNNGRTKSYKKHIQHTNN